MFLFGQKVLIRSKSSYVASSYWAEKFLFGLKGLIGRVLIGHKSSYWACSNRAHHPIYLAKNTNHSARFGFLLGVFLSGTPPVNLFFKRKFKPHFFRFFLFLFFKIRTFLYFLKQKNSGFMTKDVEKLWI